MFVTIGPIFICALFIPWKYDLASYVFLLAGCQSREKTTHKDRKLQWKPKWKQTSDSW